MPSTRLTQSFPQSGALASASYDPESLDLTITFKGARTAYTYHRVPPDVYEGLVQADSPGTYWRNSIQGQYG